jgi:predicted phosphodiesterase
MNTSIGLILPDVHRRVVQEGFWRALLKLKAELQPNWTAILGDFEDFQSVSRHVEDFDRPALEEDMGFVKLGLEELASARRKVDDRILFFEGNHEDALTRFLTANAPSLRSSLSIPQWLSTHLPKVPFTWIPQHRQPYSVGRLDLLHGHQFLAGGFSGSVGKHHAVKAVELYGRPGHIVVYGHTHRPSYFERANFWGQMRALGLGCVRTIPPEVKWLKGQPAGWANEAAVAFLTPGHAEVSVLRYNPVNQCVAWQGKTFSGSAKR